MAADDWPEGFLIMDSSNERICEDAMFPFAWDELVCRKVGAGATPAVHIWRHPAALVVGLRDRRLPGAERAMERLRGDGVQAIVRNSGGAAVPLDDGVVNISIVMPNPEGKLHFRDDFGRMVELLRECLLPWTGAVTDGEIAGAYCPGEFDLSIGGRKFCGIAQRRQARAYVVQAFVVVEGSGLERARLARRFYDEASAGTVDANYPIVDAASMASLQELAGVPSAPAFIARMKQVLLTKSGIAADLRDTGVTLEEIAAMAGQLRSRYDKTGTVGG